MIPIGSGRRNAAFPLVVWLLILANVAVYVREIEAPDPERFIDAFATIPYDVTHAVVLAPPSPPFAPLTLLTAMFVHGGLAHIAFNLLFLFVFGPTIEYLCGAVRFTAFYLLCGLAGQIAQVVVAPNSHVPEIGASGAIAGVLGAYLVRFPTASIRTIIPIGCFPLLLRLPALVVIGIWAVIQFADGLGLSRADAGIAYFAHIGGFSCGAVTIGWFAQRSGSGPRRAARSNSS